MAISYPKVSIIIPFIYDRGWLDQAISSVHEQDYQGEIELLLECSDNTVGYNINRGIEKATGKYLKYFAEDDYLTPDCISKCVIFLDTISKVTQNKPRWMHANSYILHEHGAVKVQKPKHIDNTLETMLWRNDIHGGTVMYERTLFDEVGMFDESLTTAEEYDLYLRLFKASILPGYLDQTIFYYRRHSAQKSLGNMSQEYQDKRKQGLIEIQNRYR